MTKEEIDYIEANIAEIHIEKAHVSDIAFLIKK